ncbi:MBOAT family O-acyltransferase [Haloferula rosea]|uniref:MBOAT family protein n=1 Tax=Haloferula rosea TaxID=490093 RepID=A0A934VGQ6_9BACT|nr:MBOAT family protein [Haloferula rosea]MBK1827825.1 MBOAT family protein [Haloferula rosea]
MLFNSWEFLILLGLVLALYYVPVGWRARRVWQVSVLLAGSAVFYAWENPRLLALLGFSCLLNALAVERILSWKAVGSAGQCRAKRWLFATVMLNLGLLAAFKYAGFLVSSLPDGLVSDGVVDWLSDIPLPVGISFYTFQGISLVVDVWRGDVSDTTAEHLGRRGSGRIGAVRDASFYISFFPQLVAGPIVKAHEFVDQIGAKCFGDVDWRTVRRCLILGYFLKIFVADNLAEHTVRLSSLGLSLERFGPIVLLSLLYGYSLQIFADFAGYSLIAIGLGAMFGYRLPENFRFPYLSTSITEFWRRWHMSLSSWLRDYLYIPLGGNRKGSGRTYFNLFLVMFLGGIWHGAAWKFALWGTLHGVCLAIERAWLRRAGRTGTSTTQARVIPKVFGWAVTFNVVTFLWLTFMMPDMASIFAFFKGVGSGNMGFSGPPPFSLIFYGSWVVAYHAWGWLDEHKPMVAARFKSPAFEGGIHALMLFLIVTNPGAPRGFIYFQF